MLILGSEEVLHLKSHHTLDGLVGISVREQLASTIQGNAKAQNYINKLYDSGMTAKAVLQYATTSDINIYEIGLFSIVNANTTPGSSSNVKFHSILTERTVLAEPITIKADETKLVTYEITFNQTLRMEEA